MGFTWIRRRSGTEPGRDPPPGEAFHRRILETDSPEERREQYRELYDRVHILKQQDVRVGEDPGSFDRLVLTFRKELEGRSVLDVGCGSGLFLTQLAQILPHGELWGLDTSDVTGAAQAQRPFQFFRRDVTTFTLPRQFEVVFSHQVFEHIAPPDVPAHLTSIREALVPGGSSLFACLTRIGGRKTSRGLWTILLRGEWRRRVRI